MASVVLAYWAPLYVTVDTEDGKVVDIHVVASGMRNGVRVSGQPPSASDREADQIFTKARAAQLLPEIEIR